MRKKNVSIADFDSYYDECKKNIAFDEYHINLTQIQMKNLKHIQNSMKNLNIDELPFTKKEFNTFLTMTELVEHIFGENIEFLKSEIHNLNNQLCSSRSNENRHIHHIMKLQSEIFDLEKENKKYKSKIKQLKKENKKLITHIKQTTLYDEFFISDK